MVAVPTEVPNTEPVVDMVATEDVELLQAPPAEPVLEMEIEVPKQTLSAPVMLPALGSGFTVIPLVAVAVPQDVVSV